MLAVAGILWQPKDMRDVEAQAFLDHFPCHRHHTNYWGLRFGKGFGHKPALLTRFDWYLYGEPPGSKHDHHGPSVRRHEDPRTVVASPSKWDQLAALAAGGLQQGPQRALVFAGMPERPISEDVGADPETQGQRLGVLRRAFGRVLHEYKDVDLEGVLTLPSGLNELYFRPGNLRMAMAAIAAARLDVDAKPRPLLLVHTIHWIWTAWNVTSRVEARKWANSSEGRAVGVDMRFIHPKEWWRELSMYRFLMSPTGTGIQCAKTIEALLVLTVPIVQRCVAHDDLVRYGFPLVVVDQWTEITRSNLSSWWLSSSPRLASFRRNCLTTEAYWRLIVGETERCE